MATNEKSVALLCVITTFIGPFAVKRAKRMLMDVTPKMCVRI